MPSMWVARFIKRRWAAHNQRLLDDQLYAAKLAADPAGGPSSGASGSQGVPSGVDPITAAVSDSAFGQGSAAGPTGPAQ
jgi:hypothetical protein